MKKIFALILVLMLCFCASAEPRTIDLETMTAEELESLRAEVDAAIDALNAVEAEEEPDEKTVQIELGDTIALGAVELELKSISFVDELRAESLDMAVFTAGENSKIACVACYSENTREDFSEIWNHTRFEFIVDGKHEIRADLNSGNDLYDALGYYAPESEATRYWFRADIHNDLLADYESLVLRIYYRESYSYEDSQTYLDADSADVIYELDMTPDALTEYTDKATIKAVQEAMNELGFECGTPDGVSGKKTAAAISAFQAENGLTETGTVTHETLKALRGMGMNM